jgi:hypothetical protein
MKKGSILLLLTFITSMFPQGAGKAISFDGTDDYIRVLSSADFSSTTYTWEAWYKSSAISSSGNSLAPLMIRADASGSFNGLLMGLTSAGNAKHYAKGGSGATINLDDASSALDGQWHHIAIVGSRTSGATAYIYFDGQQSASTTVTGNWSFNDNPLRMAIAYDTYWKKFIGTMDEVRIWNTALPADTIRKYMCQKITSSHSYWSNLKGYWRFDEGSGTTAQDQTSGNHDGTLVNGPSWVTSGAPIGDNSHMGVGTGNLTENSQVPVDISWDNDPGSNAIFAVIQVNQDPDVTTGLLSNYPSVYWELWIANDDGSFQADVTFHYDNISGINDESTLALYTRASAGQSWSAVSSYTLNNEGNNTDGIGSITANNLTSFSQFIITSSSSDNSLPVGLSSFEGRVGRDGVVLEWVTESEVENLGFVLERRSIGEIGAGSSGDWEEIVSYLTHPELRGQGSVAYRTAYCYVDETVEEGNTYDYRLADVNYNGVKAYQSLMVLGLKVTRVIPNEIILHPAYPNPFNPVTTIQLDLPEASEISLVIYDLLGREVRPLVHTSLEAGNYHFVWDGRDKAGMVVGSGVYFCRLMVDNGRLLGIRKVVVMR